MTYRINKTDGNLLTEIPDGVFDTGSTSLTLIGKNVTNFGEIFNENLIKLLENFSSSSAPEYPVKGQLWYDTSTGRLNVYDGVDFRASGGPLISANQPTNLVPGDLWINSNTNQLWFFDGADLVLAGPVYTNQQGLSGFKIESIVDTNNRLRVIAKLFVKNILIGIFSAEAFTPFLPIDQYTGSITVGFNASNIANNRFNVTASRAEALITPLGEVRDTEDIIFNSGDSTITGSLTLQAASGEDALPFSLRILGASTQQSLLAPRGDAVLKVENGNFFIVNQEQQRSSNLAVTTATGPITAMTIDGVTGRVGFFNNAPASDVDINGDLTVRGQLNIIGSAVTISSTELAIEDKNLELNKVTGGANTSILADGGGIVLLAEQDNSKTILYDNSLESWTSSENINLEAVNLSYMIASQTVLSETALGNGVVNSNLETLGSLQIVNLASGLTIVGNTITASGTLLLTSSGSINVDNKKIINLQDLDINSNPNDAANKKYVDDKVLSRPLSLTINIDAFVDDAPGNEAATNFILNTLQNISPIYDAIEYVEGGAVVGSVAKVAALRSQSAIFKRFKVVYVANPDAPPATIPAWVFVTDYVFKGKWKSSVSYVVQDTVTFDNGSGFREYICIDDTTPGESPTNALKWELIDSI